MARDRRRNLTRRSTVTLFGKSVGVTELLDPEIEGRVETSWTDASPGELDEMRCKAQGEHYLSIQEAERMRKARPAAKVARKMDIGAQLLRLAQAAQERDLDPKGALNLDHSEDLDDALKGDASD